ncbi:uncharacterized protein BJ171DRAFT_520005 [Polychytrium aggregatum]|uniref:uncharacterized protein n=1 Tax=Polychytrium aggregatum TaxID=110093 RepID=UPI0022FE7DC2|nr:uncharacterized protein BJ171DRAFT_520005 [Polychytrium aggregatum]KAI9197351.1 hypothetical protein BJ171DRAFT_520005 [Polychytrium aggregatum]
MQLLFSSDLHGNLKHYAQLIEEANNHGSDALLLGGDICPRRKGLVVQKMRETTGRSKAHEPPEESKEFSDMMKNDSVRLQQEWFEASLVPLLQTCRCPVYMIMGNSDFRANLGSFKRTLEALPPIQRHGREHQHITMMDGLEVTPLRLGPDPEVVYHLMGVSFIPPTPHSMKDWELMDTPEDCLYYQHVLAPRPPGYNPPPPRIYRNSRIAVDGCRSDSTDNCGSSVLSICSLSLDAKDSLEGLLHQTLSREPPLGISNIDPARLIVMAHTPPFATGLDLMASHAHVGSLGLLRFLRTVQPLVSLHGHIHETVRMSKTHIDRLQGEYPVEKGVVGVDASRRFVDSPDRTRWEAPEPESSQPNPANRSGTIAVASGNDFKKERAWCILVDVGPDGAAKVKRYQSASPTVLCDIGNLRISDHR